MTTHSAASQNVAPLGRPAGCVRILNSVADQSCPVTEAMKHVQEFLDGFVPRLVSCSDAKLLDDVFELESLSAGVDTIGICTSGLELGQSLSRMGVASSGFGKVDGIPGMADPEVNRCAQHGADYRTRAGAQP